MVLVFCNNPVGASEIAPGEFPRDKPGEANPSFGDFGDFRVSFVATVAGRYMYTRWGGPRLSVRGEPLIVPTRGP